MTTPLTPDEIRTEIRALELAIATGATKVSFSMAGGRQELEYDSLAAMIQRVNRLKGMLADAEGASRRPLAHKAVFRPGWTR